MKKEPSFPNKPSIFIGRGRGRGKFCGQGCGRGRGNQFSDTCQLNIDFQCKYWKKFGDNEKYCLTKQNDEQNQANFFKNIKNESHLFMAHSSFNNINNNA